jgi:hypothetical protein
VTSIYSGNKKLHVHHVANVVFGLSDKYQVRCAVVEQKFGKRERQLSWADRFLRGLSRGDNKTHLEDGKPSLPRLVKARATGPMTWVSLVGLLEAVILLVTSITFGDGMSMLATISLSLVSTLTGIANKWTLKLPRATGDHPRGDLVVRYPNGSFLVVKCNEFTARELFFAPEEIDYNIQSPRAYRLLSLAATLLLMLGIVLLANAKLQLQIAWAGAYGVINIAHWFAAALEPKLHWDTSAYDVTWEQPAPTGPPPSQAAGGDDLYTVALWKSIFLSGSVEWVRRNDAAPSTHVWNRWLERAQLQLDRKTATADLEEPRRSAELREIWKWDAKAEWDRISNESEVGLPSVGVKAA